VAAGACVAEAAAPAKALVESGDVSSSSSAAIFRSIVKRTVFAGNPQDRDQPGVKTPPFFDT